MASRSRERSAAPPLQLSIQHHNSSSTLHHTTSKASYNFGVTSNKPEHRLNNPQHTNHQHNGPGQGVPRDAARVRQGRQAVHHQVQQAYVSLALFLITSGLSCTQNIFRRRGKGGSHAPPRQITLEERCPSFLRGHCTHPYSIAEPRKLTKLRSSTADKREFLRISQAVGMGFLIMGVIGYVVKLSEFPFP